MTRFKLNNKTVSSVKELLAWGLDNAEFRQCAMMTVKDENGMQQVIPNPPEFAYGETISLIDEEDIKTLEIMLKFEDRETGKRLVLRIDVETDEGTRMIYLGLTEEYFDDLERKDVLTKICEDIEGYA